MKLMKSVTAALLLSTMMVSPFVAADSFYPVPFPPYSPPPVPPIPPMYPRPRLHEMNRTQHTDRGVQMQNGTLLKVIAARF